MASPLDNPAWWALTGPQKHLGAVRGSAARFDPLISPFGALADVRERGGWTDLAAVTDPGGGVALVAVHQDSGRPSLAPGPGWTPGWEGDGVQMIADRVDPKVIEPRMGPGAEDHPEALGKDDVPDMLVLAATAQPGPFLLRTVEFGGYFGIRRAGQLVAMAGRRLHPPGFVEISAVATHPDHRRHGLAELLVRTVVGDIVESGDVPFLHATKTNTNAIRLYRAMGFTVRRTVTFRIFRAPGGPDSAHAPTAT